MNMSERALTPAPLMQSDMFASVDDAAATMQPVRSTPLSDEDVLSVISAHLENSETYEDYVTPLDYYLGNPRGDEVVGRSRVISTDVADAIEWIMPQIMKALTSSNEIVVFDPTSQADELQAELESQYVYDVIMKENPGFVILHQFVKDALLHKNGIIKVFYEEVTDVRTGEYTGLDEQSLVVLTSDPRVQILELSQEQDPLLGTTYATRIAITTKNGRIVLESVAPEEFRLSRSHNSIDVSTARFTAHIMTKTASDLKSEGFDPAIVDELPDSNGIKPTDFRFNAQNESSQGDWKLYSNDSSMREIDLAECYLYMDVNGDGIAEYVKATVVVDTALNASDLLSIESLDASPWVTTTAILMSHKFRGLSIYDRLKQIQDAKTALWRNTLDNLYLQNNQRTIAVENQVNMGDLTVSRPGGVIRAKRIDAVAALATPSIGVDAMNMLNYLDNVRAGRVGVAPEGEVTPQRIGERVGSEGVQSLLSAKEELVGLIVRVIAETGVKPLCTKIRDLCTKHMNAIQDYKFRGNWVKVQPTTWLQRSNTRTSVRVGTGTGNVQKKLASLEKLLTVQQAIFQMPGQSLVDQSGVYAALDDIAKFSELLGAGKYFIDPNSDAGKQKAQESAANSQKQQQEQMQQQIAMLQFQAKLAEAEMQKAQAQADANQLKAQVETLKAQLQDAKTHGEMAGKDADRELEKYKINTNAALKLTEIEVTAKAQQEANAVANREALEGDDSGTEGTT